MRSICEQSKNIIAISVRVYSDPVRNVIRLIDTTTSRGRVKNETSTRRSNVFFSATREQKTKPNLTRLKRRAVRNARARTRRLCRYIPLRQGRRGHIGTLRRARPRRSRSCTFRSPRRFDERVRCAVRRTVWNAVGRESTGLGQRLNASARPRTTVRELIADVSYLWVHYDNDGHGARRARDRRDRH